MKFEMQSSNWAERTSSRRNIDQIGGARQGKKKGFGQKFEGLANLNVLGKPGADGGSGRCLGGRFAEKLHSAITMAEPSLLGARLEKQRLLVGQLTAGIAG